MCGGHATVTRDGEAHGECPCVAERVCQRTDPDDGFPGAGSYMGAKASIGL
jgi:hypothetical protein